MAEQYSGLDIPLIASSGMDASAYYFVKMSTENTISICSASGPTRTTRSCICATTMVVQSRQQR